MCIQYNNVCSHKDWIQIVLQGDCMNGSAMSTRTKCKINSYTVTVTSLFIFTSTCNQKNTDYAFCDVGNNWKVPAI